MTVPKRHYTLGYFHTLAEDCVHADDTLSCPMTTDRLKLQMVNPN